MCQIFDTPHGSSSPIGRFNNSFPMSNFLSCITPGSNCRPPGKWIYFQQAMTSGQSAGVFNYTNFIINTINNGDTGLFFRINKLMGFVQRSCQRKTLLGGVPNRVSRRWE